MWFLLFHIFLQGFQEGYEYTFKENIRAKAENKAIIYKTALYRVTL